MSPPRPLLSREFVLSHKRSRILDAVAELSAEHGYKAMTISEIVSRAGVARKTLYESYGGKEEVFLAALGAGFSAAFERIEAACAGAEGEWSERVIAALAGLLEYLADHPAEAHMLIVEAPAATTASAGEYQAAIARVTTSLSEATPTVDGDSGVIEESVVGGVAWILNCRLREGKAERLHELTPDLSDFVLAPWA